jgi:O-acetyl-ADP-ribose deacetylase (regulator of RNase III)
LANERGFKSVAFPAISCGVFAFPLPAAARVAMQVTLKISRAPARARALSLSAKKEWASARAHIQTCSDAQLRLCFAHRTYSQKKATEEEAGRLELVEFVLFSSETYAAFAAAARERFRD